jgi:multidrug efflux pump subunit AcrA (membrane-fusion protein)
MPAIDQETIQRHTEEIQDIIGAPPAWLVRWGITLFFAVLVLILSLAELIRYPDIVKTQLKIRSLNLPQPVTTTIPGKLIKILVQNNQKVSAGKALAIIESANGSVTLTASKAGRLTYASIIHENQELLTNQTLFYVITNDKDLFGEMIIPQGNIGKVKVDQEVMIKLKGYPYEEYGMLHGTIKYIVDGAFRGGEYIAEVDFKTQGLTDMNKPIELKQGMIANAEIITQSSSLFKRLTADIFKNINHQ